MDRLGRAKVHIFLCALPLPERAPSASPNAALSSGERRGDGVFCLFFNRRFAAQNSQKNVPLRTESERVTP